MEENVLLKWPAGIQSATIDHRFELERKGDELLWPKDSYELYRQAFEALGFEVVSSD